MFLFIVFALIAIVAAVGVIVSRKPVYSALFLLLNFATLAALYIMLQAQFLAAVQIIVYAGAIVVLFLFVVMLIGGGELGAGDRETSRQGDKAAASSRFPIQLGWQRITALVLGVLLLAGVVYGLVTGQLHAAQGTAAAFGQGSVEAIAAALYTDYLLPFELTSVLLLVGMVGAVVLAQRDNRL
ncbi:MAG: NADH-quinone oxidoreductase subunit J [Chloroflexi bacterium]|nr:NADH-quinone oxidoreductase subunit J [Chloroflexota bacterium]